MSHLQYYAYEKFGIIQKEKYSYSQAVRIGDRIECAGQGKLIYTASLPQPPKGKKEVRCKQSSAHAILIARKSGSIGGWDAETGVFEREINAQIDLAFANVERCLLDAGGKGWSQVFRVNSYHVPMNDEALGAMVRNFQKYMPGHQPLWTCVGVTRLGADDMRVEIEVVAHDPEGAEAAKTASK